MFLTQLISFLTFSKLKGRLIRFSFHSILLSKLANSSIIVVCTLCTFFYIQYACTSAFYNSS
nr:hypothetical protein [Cressdnaviricota sp.]